MITFPSPFLMQSFSPKVKGGGGGNNKVEAIMLNIQQPACKVAELESGRDPTRRER